MNTTNEITDTQAVDAVRAGLCGALLQPGDEGYDAAARAWNLSVTQRPSVVVMAENAADIVAAVSFARGAGMGVGVMATGHGVGSPCDGGVLINTSRMRGVHIDPAARTARVEAGALWKDVIAAAEPHGLAGLAGSAPHVGVVGYTMGGGFGYLGRKYGLNSASVVAAEIVTADGELLRVGPAENADLFWALGGGGNFGVVTALEFRLYPLKTVYGGAVFYPVERAPEALGRYAGWSAELSDEISVAFAFMNVPPLPTLPEALRGRSVVVIRGCYCGERPEDGAELFRPVREGIGAPILDTFSVIPVSAMDTITRDPVDPLGVLQYTGLLAELSPRAIDALVEVAGAGSGSPLLMVELRRLGGALARTPNSVYPMGSGDARYSLNALGATFSPAMAERIAAHLARLASATRPYQTGETFLNYLEHEPTVERIRTAYSVEDWDRLVELKTAYDPDNVFRFNRNIPPRAGEKQ